MIYIDFRRAPTGTIECKGQTLTTNNALYGWATASLRRLYDRRLDSPAVLDAARFFPDAQRFGGAWELLRAEALHIQEGLSAVPLFHELMAQQADISAADPREWRMFVVKAYGVDFAANAARCPQLSALVAQCPQVVSASLSFLAPGKHVPVHRGPFRGVIRYYLGLSVPPDADGQPGTILTVDGTAFRLGDGQGLLWDDTYPHEVHNRSAAVRIALLLDVRRCALPWHLAWINALVIGAIGLAIRLRQPPGLRAAQRP